MEAVDDPDKQWHSIPFTVPKVTWLEPSNSIQLSKRSTPPWLPLPSSSIFHRRPTPAPTAPAPLLRITTRYSPTSRAFSWRRGRRRTWTQNIPRSSTPSSPSPESSPPPTRLSPPSWRTKAASWQAQGTPSSAVFKFKGANAVGSKELLPADKEYSTDLLITAFFKGMEEQREVVDLHTLLVHCAKAVTDDRRSAGELLKEIKKHASPTGDATQRLAYCFAEGLEARLAGTGSQVYRSLAAKRTSAVEFLKAYQLFMSTCCFRKVAFSFANKAIFNAAVGRSRLHIVDYGLHHGFQWPELLRWLGARDGGPPEVRITRIDQLCP